jgi:hypothetical protein
MSSNPGNAPRAGQCLAGIPAARALTGWLVPDRRIEHVLEHKET